MNVEDGPAKRDASPMGRPPVRSRPIVIYGDVNPIVAAALADLITKESRRLLRSFGSYHPDRDAVADALLRLADCHVTHSRLLSRRSSQAQRDREKEHKAA